MIPIPPFQRVFSQEDLQMYKLISRNRKIGQLAVCLFASLALTAPVHANYIHPGKVPPAPPAPPPPAPPPPSSFTEKYTWTPPGGKAVPFSITVTPGESADDKADAIVAAIEALPGGSASRNTTNTNHPEEVSTGGTIALVASTSGETDKTFSLGPSGPGSYVAIGFGGGLTGTVLGDGATATYDTAFGYDGLLAQSSISYDNLFNKTLDGLLTATYDNLLAELPVSFQNNLNLDLATETIRFDLPSTANNPFVVGDSLDQGVFYSERVVTTAPEPSSIALVTIGAFWAMVAARLRRRRQPGE
jgi:hypothetical protein